MADYRGRMQDAEFLAGAAEVGHVLGVASNTLNAWRRRSTDFPEPVVQLKAGGIWDIREVIAWADASGRGVVQRDYQAPRGRAAGPRRSSHDQRSS